MKKIALLSLFALALGFVSCKKDRTCTCTYNKVGSSDVDVKVTTYIKVTNKTALATCNSGTSFDQADPYKVETRNCSLN